MKFKKFLTDIKKYVQFSVGLLLLLHLVDRMLVLLTWIVPHRAADEYTLKTLELVLFAEFIVAIILIHLSLKNFGAKTIFQLTLCWLVLIILLPLSAYFILALNGIIIGVR